MAKSSVTARFVRPGSFRILLNEASVRGSDRSESRPINIRAPLRSHQRSPQARIFFFRGTRLGHAQGSVRPCLFLLRSGSPLLGLSRRSVLPGRMAQATCTLRYVALAHGEEWGGGRRSMCARRLR